MKSDLTATQKKQIYFNMPALSTKYFFLWLLGRLKRRRIKGSSMSPTLSENSEILISTNKKHINNLKIGDILYLQHPLQHNTHIVKRLTAIKKNAQHYFVTGDNPNYSTDSRHFGPIAPTIIIGKVVCTFP